MIKDAEQPGQKCEVHAFVCTKTKDGKESCGAKGSAELRERLKAWVKNEGLGKRVKVTASLCLGHCEKGISVCIYPAGQWYFNVDQNRDEESLKKEILSYLK